MEQSSSLIICSLQSISYIRENPPRTHTSYQEFAKGIKETKTPPVLIMHSENRTHRTGYKNNTVKENIKETHDAGAQDKGWSFKSMTVEVLTS